jgi:hypothetical protein
MLIQASDLKAVKTSLFPYWTKTNSVIQLFCGGGDRMKPGLYSFMLEEDPAAYPHIFFGPVIHMRNVTAK